MKNIAPSFGFLGGITMGGQGSLWEECPRADQRRVPRPGEECLRLSITSRST